MRCGESMIIGSMDLAVEVDVDGKFNGDLLLRIHV